jgi:hypothetical protein
MVKVLTNSFKNFIRTSGRAGHDVESDEIGNIPGMYGPPHDCKGKAKDE